jgi:hypothetical protein
VAQVTYSTNGKYGTIPALIGDKLIDESFTGTKSGYRYTVEVSPDGTDYTAEAIPVSSNMGRWGYYSHPDGVVRFSIITSLAPDGQAGRAVH